MLGLSKMLICCSRRLWWWCLFVSLVWVTCALRSSLATCSVPGLSVLASVFRDENSCWPESITLFLLNAVLALLSTSACLSICHAKHVVSLDTTVNTAVTWNRLSKFFSFILWWFNSVEHSQSIFIRLLSLIISVLEIDSLRLAHGLLLSCISTFNTVELVYGSRRNGLNMIML